MKLSIPKSIDGDILFYIENANQDKSSLSFKQDFSSFSLKYRKESEKITPISRHEGINESDSEENNNLISKTIKIDTTPYSKIKIDFKIYEKGAPFILIASDKFKA